jgi:hypothetical protein
MDVKQNNIVGIVSIHNHDLCILSAAMIGLLAQAQPTTKNMTMIQTFDSDSAIQTLLLGFFFASVKYLQYKMPAKNATLQMLRSS